MATRCTAVREHAHSHSTTVHALTVRTYCSGWHTGWERPFGRWGVAGGGAILRFLRSQTGQAKIITRGTEVVQTGKSRVAKRGVLQRFVVFITLRHKYVLPASDLAPPGPMPGPVPIPSERVPWPHASGGLRVHRSRGVGQAPGGKSGRVQKAPFSLKYDFRIPSGVYTGPAIHRIGPFTL